MTRYLSEETGGIAMTDVNIIRGVVLEVVHERMRQDIKWGGAEHDDKHSVHDFIRWIKNYASWADQMADMFSYEKTRRRLIQVASLAVAAVESLDRKHKS